MNRNRLDEGFETILTYITFRSGSKGEHCYSWDNYDMFCLVLSAVNGNAW